MVRMPSPEQQARFFTNLQLLLTEGKFVSTYKFALLIALVRWAIENPDYDENEPLNVAELAPHFAELYWPQVMPFASGRKQRPLDASASAEREWDGVLVQNQVGPVLNVFKAIATEQQEGREDLLSLPVVKRRDLLAKVQASIATEPLWKLHTIAGREMQFLYRRGDGKRWIRFEPGIVACLVNFALLVEDAVRSAWLRFVLRCNPLVLGAACQVEEFLFPAGRNGLVAWRDALLDVSGPRCFYCEREIQSDPDVDHFLPWSRYPRDLGHNFVLAHADCNQRKKNHLASCDHLERWHRRNDDLGPQLVQRFEASRLPHDWLTLRRVASSLYHMAANANASVWQAGNKLVPLSAEWRRILGCA